jgi:hypothetical protein
MPVFFIVLFIALFVILAIYGARAAAKRQKELTAWAAANRLRFSEDHDADMDSRFPDFDCLGTGKDRYAYNIMDGEWEGRPFLGFDYHYETESKDSKGKTTTHHHNFSAVILRSAVPLKPLLIRPEGFFDKLAEFVGFDDIDFESAEFSRKFYVKSPDRKWAYDVIHQRAMEFLLARPRFTIQFDRAHVIAYNGSVFGATDFESAVRVSQGILDLFPEYLVQQQKQSGG